MQNFVRRKDNGTHDNDDLKMHLPGTSAARGKLPQEVKSHPGKQQPQVKTEPHAGQDIPHAKVESDAEPPFYDTDASSIGRTSTTASMRQDTLKRPAENEYQQDVDDPDEQQRSASEEDEESGYEEADDPTENQNGMPKNLRDFDRAIQSGEIPGPQGMSFGYVKGDSYPTTTSGNPSISESHNGGGARNTDGQNMYNAGARSLQNRQASRRQLNPAHQNQTRANATDAAPSRAAPAHVSRPAASNLEVNHNAAPPGFIFAPARNTHQKTPSGTSIHAPSTNTAQPASVPTNGDGSNFVQPQQSAEKNQTLGKLPYHSKSIHSRQPAHHSARDQNVASTSTRDIQRLPGEGEETGHEQSLHPRTIHHESEQEMDYVATELHGMDYHALKNEVFDVNPNTKEFRFESGGEDDSISDVVGAVSRLQPTDQAHFFRSLTIEQWEQAGDWFLDQFSGVVDKLKNVRQEKRKAARAFEDEIEGRYKAVGQKRKQIDGALAEMRESGGKVLQGTPKKTKTK